MDNINIDDILAKHSPNYRGAVKADRTSRAIMSGASVKAAIKEIVEKVIDKCAGEATAKEVHLEYSGHMSLNRTKCYGIIDRQSILDVKTQINYE